MTVTLLAMFGVVLFGSIIPVVPTGPAVSAAAVLARAEHAWEVVLVVAGGALGAYLGDVTTYLVLRRAGAPLARRVGWLRADDPDAALARIRHGIEQHEVRSLLVSRLVPGGRVPVLLAAALGGYPAERYVVAATGAATLWATTYTAIGVVGDHVVPDPQLAIVTAVVAAVAVSLVAHVVAARRRSTP